jgi:hypothetical protein
MGRPSDDAFESMIKKGKICNNPVTAIDYKNAVKIYGKELGTVKGKTIRKKTQHVQVDVEAPSKEKQRVILSIDIMYFTGITFLITVS